MTTPYSVLLVDDERIARAGLRAMLARYPELHVIGEARDGDEAVQAIRALKPDVVFLDIQMPGRCGFAVLEAVAGLAPRPAVVVVTAYPTFALQAYEADAVDYLHKPFDDMRLAQTVQRIVRFLRGARTPLPPVDREVATRPQRLLLRGLGESVFVDPSEISSVSVEGNYLKVQTAAGEQIIRATLDGFTRELPAGFLRVSRSALINLAQVRSIRPASGGRYQLELQSGENVVSSRRYGRAVRAALQTGDERRSRRDVRLR